MPRIAAQARRTGLFTSSGVQVPANASGKYQVSFDIQAADRTDAGLSLSVQVQVSDDGATNWRESFGFTWNGNTKGFKSGWPTTGPAIRVDAADFAGKWLRVIADAPTGVRYAIDVDQI